MLDPDYLKLRLEMVLPLKNRELAYYGLQEFKEQDLLDLCASWRQKFGKRIVDTLPIVRDAYKAGKTILLEGHWAS